MRVIKLLLLFLFVSGSAIAQNDTTKYFKSNDYGWKYQRLKPYMLILPTDTTVNKLGFATRNGVLYLGNGTYWTSAGGSGGGGWLLTGNGSTTPGTNFIGTTDAQDLYLKTNAATRLVIPSGGIASSTASTDSVLVAKTDGYTLGKISKDDLLTGLVTDTQLDAKQDTAIRYGYMVDTTISQSVSGGTTNYYSNYYHFGTPSASLTYKLTCEFTLTTKPTATTEGIFLGKLSVNGVSQSSMVARAVYVDASNWTIKLYYVTAFSTEILLASTPIYTNSTIAMTNGANYRIEVSFSSPTVQVDFSRIDTSVSYNESVIEKISVPYTYLTVIGGNSQIANTSWYAFGSMGATPAGVYAVHKMQVYFGSFKNVDVAFVGNSITAGYNSSSPKYSLPRYLMDGTGMSYAVFAGSGDRTDEILSRLDEVNNTNPKFIINEFGWNDISHGSTSATFSANLDSILRNQQTNGSTPIVLRLPQAAFGFDTAFKNVCARRNVKLIDVTGTLIGTLDAFDIHPNDEGFMRIANLIRLRCPEIFGNVDANLLSKFDNSLSKIQSSSGAATDYNNTYFIDATSADVRLDLPAPNPSIINRKLKVVRIDNSAHVVTISTVYSGSGTINGTSTITVCPNQYDAVDVICNTSSTWVSPTVSGSQWTTSGSNIYYNSGKVGIGTTTPGTVNGTTFSSLGLHVKSTAGSGYVASEANGPAGMVLNDNSQVADSRLWGFANSSTKFVVTKYTDAGSPTNLLSITRSGVTTISGTLGVGTTPVASAILDVSSTTQGFLPPRMTATQASAISSPAEGLIVYVTNTNGTFTTKGWWGYNGATWQQF